jgi:two-component system sensor histidine kinase CreC
VCSSDLARARAPLLRIEVRADTNSEDDLAVEGDPFLLRRAIGNLLDNALAFSTPGKGAGDEPDIVLTLSHEGWMARIEVRDHGPGIPEFAQDKVFDKFFSLPRPGSGKRSTGLGLAFVREIATLHQGSITLTNADGGGALAVLRLPLVNDK